MLDRNPSSIQAERDREKIVDAVLCGVCAAIERAFARGGDAIVAAAARVERAGHKSRATDAPSSPLAGWIFHGGGVYHHVSDPSILVKRIGRGHVRREGRPPMRVNMWGWRLADDTGAWRGETPTRFGAFEAARREMAGADV